MHRERPNSNPLGKKIFLKSLHLFGITPLKRPHFLEKLKKFKIPLLVRNGKGKLGGIFKNFLLSLVCTGKSQMHTRFLKKVEKGQKNNACPKADARKAALHRAVVFLK